MTTLPRAVLRAGIALSFLLPVLSGCVVHPAPITAREMQTQRAADVQEIRHAQPLPRDPITLHQAMARALLYNYDQKLALMQQAFALKQADLANYAMLPQVVADVAYVRRNNFNAARSSSLFTGQESLELSTSEDRSRVVSDLTLTWNILDFGVSYLQAHQQADLALAAQEARRVTIDTVTQQVRSAYWQAVAAERTRPKVDAAIERVGAALKDSQSVETGRAGDRLTALAYQRTLLDTLGQLQVQRRQIDQQRIQLATLMGLPPESEFAIATDSENPPVERPEALASIEELEEYALVNRPESRQEAYLKRVSAADTRIALIKMFPGLNLIGAWKSDSNQYLRNHHWVTSAAQVSWNLVSLVSGPAAISSARAAEEVGHTRRLALSMAIMMQVRMAVLAYRDALSSYQAAAELSTVDHRILAQTETMAVARRVAAKEVVAAELNDILSSLKRDLAYADLQNAVASIFLSVGADPLPSAVGSTDIDAIASALDSSEAKWLSGEFYKTPEHIGG
jgi:outer membrane protein TolC